MNKLELGKLHKKVPTKDPPREEPKIFLHALLITTTPCALKMVGYINHLNVIIFWKLKHSQFHLSLISIRIHFMSTWSTLFKSWYRMVVISVKMKLQMRDYFLKSSMFLIEIGGCDVILKQQWLQTLGPVTIDLKELYTSFNKKGHKHTIKDLQLVHSF